MKTPLLTLLFLVFNFLIAFSQSNKTQGGCDGAIIDYFCSGADSILQHSSGDTLYISGNDTVFLRGELYGSDPYCQTSPTITVWLRDFVAIDTVYGYTAWYPVVQTGVYKAYCTNLSAITQWTWPYLTIINTSLTGVNDYINQDVSISFIQNKIKLSGRAQGKLKLVVHDITGRNLFAKSVSNLNLPFEVDFSDLPAGVYIVSVLSDGFKINKKVNVLH